MIPPNSQQPSSQQPPSGASRQPSRTWVDRVLAVADESDRSGQAVKVRAFQIFLLLHVAVRTWFWAIRGDDELWFRVLLVGGLTLCALTGLVADWARPAAAIATALLVAKLLESFPITSNHFFVELLCVALLAFCDLSSADERALLLEAVRWLTVIVLFYSGLQKVLYGTYFHAEFLGYAIATKGTFASVFAWLLPPEELARLRSLRTIGVGAGPYGIDMPLAVLLSNGVYMFEMLAAPLLLWRRSRGLVAVAVIGFTVAIQLGAREIMFGALFINLLLLFLVQPVNRVVLPAFVALYAVLFASRVHLLPKLVFN